ncbi:hypothetical protein SISNIDRAFT_471090 [Sistotremastrum niveocremeum HHB9708]|uniref:Uncharacterized protein n=1 Tax=Sistotremastrum niveocremeum HHB9708 TaxID=1314777 RepID=A0A164N487_9AGAM|nr:hypothetical protein SISNIDRAFT_471090 [Sistotremastrum niveocremeum HHB9708]
MGYDDDDQEPASDAAEFQKWFGESRLLSTFPHDFCDHEREQKKNETGTISMEHTNPDIPLKFLAANAILHDNPYSEPHVVNLDFINDHEHRVRLIAHILELFTIEREKLRDRWVNSATLYGDRVGLTRFAGVLLPIVVLQVLDHPDTFRSVYENFLASDIVTPSLVASAVRYASDIRVETLMQYANMVRTSVAFQVRLCVYDIYQPNDDDSDSDDDEDDDEGPDEVEEAWYEQRVAHDVQRYIRSRTISWLKWSLCPLSEEKYGLPYVRANANQTVETNEMPGEWERHFR